ncbi:MAG: hypothetical protein COT17_06320 [Elusimicrobia bacterium CG08_land_8_20_14_0_20_51_18]|nr:MAG: hypothetical protein COT17_06320 [Elusimicrobia bacterium CG08_land_8_20_14_0_20_51_18]
MINLFRNFENKIVTFYVFKYFLRYFAVSIAVFIFLFLIASFIQVVNEEGVMNGFSGYLLLKSLLFLVPNILSVSVPFSLIMSVMLTIGEISSNGELTAIRAGGYSYGEISSFLSFFSLALCFFLLVSNNWISPAGLKKSRENVRTMFTRITNINISSGTFEKISAFTIYAAKASRDGELAGVLLTRKVEKKGDTPPSLISISAGKGSYGIIKEKGIKIDLLNGNFSQFNTENNSVYVWGDFEKYSTFMPFSVEENKDRTVPPRELTSPELLAATRTEGNPEYAFKCAQELFSRIFLSLTPLAFFLLAASLGFIFDRESKSFGFFISILTIFCYYGLVILAEFFTAGNRWAFPWALGVPLFITLAFGVFLWKYRLENK